MQKFPDQDLDKKHAENPEPGDYWNECLSGTCVILAVEGDQVTLCKKRKQVGPDHWTWDFSEIKTLSKTEFKRWISYDSIDGFWISVMPAKHEWAVEAYLATLEVNQ